VKCGHGFDRVRRYTAVGLAELHRGVMWWDVVGEDMADFSQSHQGMCKSGAGGWGGGQSGNWLTQDHVKKSSLKGMFFAVIVAD